MLIIFILDIKLFLFYYKLYIWYIFMYVSLFILVSDFRFDWIIILNIMM